MGGNTLKIKFATATGFPHRQFHGYQTSCQRLFFQSSLWYRNIGTWYVSITVNQSYKRWLESKGGLEWLFLFPARLGTGPHKFLCWIKRR